MATRDGYEVKGPARLGQSASPWPRILPGAALAIFMLAFMAVYGVRTTDRLLRLGVADHVHCAIDGTYPKQTERTQMITALGPYSLMLDPILRQTAGDPVVSAHRCTVAGHDYMHIIVRHQGKPLSVIMTKHEKGEAFPRFFSNGIYASPAEVRTGEVDGYAASGFRAGNYFTYVVSSLPETENRGLAEKIAPVIRRYTGA